MDQGDCFFNKAAPGLPSHPWIILSFPPDDPSNVVIVNLTDAANHDDKSCVLKPSDHPGVITKTSCVNYRDAIITDMATLQHAKKSGLLDLKPPVPDDTLDKIISGAVETDELRNAIRALLRQQGILPE
ncbi:MAG TPA: hypothetical protein VFI31_24615 [Pirellulales bacterium]|nr:hypothetical protein [Pirellulales bacterium]